MDIMPKLFWNTTNSKQKELEKYDYCKPKFDEALYYRIIFNNYYPKADKIIPYYWIPKWCSCY